MYLNTNTFGKYLKYFFKYFSLLGSTTYYVGNRKATRILGHIVCSNNQCFAHMMTGRPVLGSIVIANYITVTTGLEISIHRSKGQNILFVMLSQEVHIKMPMLPSEETLLMTARVLWGSVTAQLQSQPGNQNSLAPAWSRTKEQRGYWPKVTVRC